MRNFQETFEIRKRSFISAFSMCRTVPLKDEDLSNINNNATLCRDSPANIYLFKVNNRNISKRCEICSKLTIEHIANLLLTLNIFHTFF